MTLYDVEYTSYDPFLPTVDLNRFEQLSESDRMRTIIRVLCGLVAMEETVVPDAVNPAATPTPGTLRELPMLGIEANGDEKRRKRPRGWNTALLPFLGGERPY